MRMDFFGNVKPSGPPLINRSVLGINHVAHTGFSDAATHAWRGSPPPGWSLGSATDYRPINKLFRHILPFPEGVIPARGERPRPSPNPRASGNLRLWSRPSSCIPTTDIDPFNDKHGRFTVELQEST